eukprot:Opistho-2@53158
MSTPVLRSPQRHASAGAGAQASQHDVDTRDLAPQQSDMAPPNWHDNVLQSRMTEPTIAGAVHTGDLGSPFEQHDLQANAYFFHPSHSTLSPYNPADIPTTEPPGRISTGGRHVHRHAGGVTTGIHPPGGIAVAVNDHDGYRALLKTLTAIVERNAAEALVRASSANQSTALTPGATTTPAGAVAGSVSSVPPPRRKAKVNPLGRKDGVAAPMNSFMLFAQRYRPVLRSYVPSVHNGILSEMLSKLWGVMPLDTKEEYRRLSREMREAVRLAAQSGGADGGGSSSSLLSREGSGDSSGSGATITATSPTTPTTLPLGFSGSVGSFSSPVPSPTGMTRLQGLSMSDSQEPLVDWSGRQMGPPLATNPPRREFSDSGTGVRYMPASGENNSPLTGIRRRADDSDGTEVEEGGADAPPPYAYGGAATGTQFTQAGAAAAVPHSRRRVRPYETNVDASTRPPEGGQTHGPSTISSGQLANQSIMSSGVVGVGQNDRPTSAALSGAAGGRRGSLTRSDALTNDNSLILLPIDFRRNLPSVQRASSDVAAVCESTERLSQWWGGGASDGANFGGQSHRTLRKAESDPTHPSPLGGDTSDGDTAFSLATTALVDSTGARVHWRFVGRDANGREWYSHYWTLPVTLVPRQEDGLDNERDANESGDPRNSGDQWMQ